MPQPTPPDWSHSSLRSTCRAQDVCQNQSRNRAQRHVCVSTPCVSKPCVYVCTHVSDHTNPHAHAVRITRSRTQEHTRQDGILMARSGRTAARTAWSRHSPTGAPPAKAIEGGRAKGGGGDAASEAGAGRERERRGRESGSHLSVIGPVIVIVIGPLVASRVGAGGDVARVVRGPRERVLHLVVPPPAANSTALRFSCCQRTQRHMNRCQ